MQNVSENILKLDFAIFGLSYIDFGWGYPRGFCNEGEFFILYLSFKVTLFSIFRFILTRRTPGLGLTENSTWGVQKYT